MKIWGVAISLLGAATVLLLGFIAIQMLQGPEAISPIQPQPKPQVVELAPVGDDRLELQKIELERERLVVETLRLKAQIQSELAKMELALRKEADAPVANPEAVAVADEGRVDIEVEPPSMQNFEPDPIAYGDFREPLEPFGNWSESADYGPVWSPASTFADDGWAPYTHGSWGYSDYGWSWTSDEPFGWACYHYGRWIRLVGHGWCWVPGRDWAPAWVAWRTCETHVAWAPLPPCARWNRQLGIGNWVDAYCGIGPESYCFVERKDFGVADCRRVILARGKNLELVGRSKNITHLRQGNRYVHNGGPEFDHSSKFSTRPIPRLKVDPAAESESLRKRIAAVSADGGKKPAPLKILAAAKPDRGWGKGVGRAGGDDLRLRQQILSEARRALAAGVGEVVAVKAKGEARDSDPAPRALPKVIAKSPSEPSSHAAGALSDRQPNEQRAAEKQRTSGDRRSQAEIRAKEIAKAEADARKVTADAAAEREGMRKVEARATEEERAARLARAETETKSRRDQEERASSLARAEAEAKGRREQQEQAQQEQAAMLARKQAEVNEQTARQAEDRERQQKVREQQERAAVAQAKQDRERQMIVENEARARALRERQAAAAQREATERQARAAAEEAEQRQRRAAAEQDARRRMDEQNRRAATAKAKEQQERRDRAEADRKRQDQVARDRRAAEERQREQAKREAQARENQQRQAAAEEASRRKQAEDALERQAQHQREQQKQRAEDAARERERAAGGGSKSKGR